MTTPSRDRALDVGLLAPVYRPEAGPGGECFARTLATGLVGAGHNPRVIAGHGGWFARDVEHGFQVWRVPRLAEGQLALRRIEAHLTHVPFSYAALRACPPDVAHALHPADGVAAAHFARATGRPSVLTYIGIPDRRSLLDRRMRLKLTVQAAEGADAVVALSAVAAAAFHRTLGVDARVIPPGIDVDFFSPGGTRAPDPTILCPAPVDAGVADLLGAMPRVRRERPGTRLLLSRALGLAARIRPSRDEGIELVDVDDAESWREAYRRAWVTALPSTGESLACGTPIVGRDHSVISELVADDSLGTLFEGGADSLAKALLGMLDLVKDSAVPERCRERADDFSMERCTREYLALYEELLAAKG